MTRISVIAVFGLDDKMLLCKRQKAPYKGLYDVVGGRAEASEDDLSCAYRELCEETGITGQDIFLHHVMGIDYPLSGICVQVYFGKLNKEVTLLEEINPLVWMDTNQNFWDPAIFSGEGYLAQVLAEINKHLQLIS